MSKIEELQGILCVEELARRVGLSQSALERRFRKVNTVDAKVLNHASGRFGCEAVAFGFLVEFAGGHRAANLMRDVAEVTERAGGVAFVNRSAQVSDFAVS